MKKLILSLLLLVSAAAFAQDVFLGSPTTPFLVVARGTSWVGLTGTNYIFGASSPNVTACLYVTNNNPTNPHSLAITAFQTGDPAVNTYLGNTYRWQPVIVGINTNNLSIASLSTIAIPIQTTAAANVVINFVAGGAGGAPDTADIFVIQTQGTGGCGNTITPLSPQAITCPYSSSVSLTNTQALTNIQSTLNARTYICSIAIFFGSAPTAGNIQIKTGSGSNCATPENNLISIPTLATTPLVIQLGGNMGTVIQSQKPGSAVCVSTATIAASGATLNYTFASF